MVGSDEGDGRGIDREEGCDSIGLLTTRDHGGEPDGVGEGGEGEVDEQGRGGLDVDRGRALRERGEGQVVLRQKGN